MSNAAYDPSKETDLDSALIGSPLKKPRASSLGIENEFRRSTSENLARGLGFGYTGPSKSELKPEGSPNFGGALGNKPEDTTTTAKTVEPEIKAEDREHLMVDEDL